MRGMPAKKSLRGGVDLGGTKVQAIIVDDEHNIVSSSRRPTPTKGGPPAVEEVILEAIVHAAEGAGFTDTSLLRGVGIGAPGDVRDGVVSRAHNLPEWESSYPLGERLEGTLECPVRLSNDVTVATNAEFILGAGQGCSSLLGVFWGSGVGGGIILDGVAWEGLGAAGEIGHMVVKDKGALCTCGRQGCMEAYAGRVCMEEWVRREMERGRKTCLLEMMEEKGKKRLTSSIWARALRKRDKLAQKAVEQAVWAMGLGIASAVNLIDVEAVVIGGGFGLRMGQPYVELIAEAMKPHLFSSERLVPVHLAALGDFSGALGGALLID